MVCVLLLQEQYIFIHDVLLEYIQSGETEVRDSALAAYVEELEAEPAASGISGMEKQYKVAHHDAYYPSCVLK